MVERGSPSGHLNKRTPRGSLWLPSLETVQVCHVDLQHSQFFLFLIRIDEELAAQAQGAGCSCGGVLHRANYPRKPRGCPSAALRDAFSSRLSFCCSRCRPPAHHLDVGALPGPVRVSGLGGGAAPGSHSRAGRDGQHLLSFFLAQFVRACSPSWRCPNSVNPRCICSGRKG